MNVGERDQHHAKALEQLREADGFFLVTYDAKGMGTSAAAFSKSLPQKQWLDSVASILDAHYGEAL